MFLYTAAGVLEGEMLVEAASISKKINGITTLEVTTVMQDEISNKIVSASIIEADNYCFRVQKINRTNAGQRKISVSCECKCVVDLLDRYVDNFEVSNALFQTAVNNLLSGEGYTIEVSSDITGSKGYEAANTNKYKILQDLLALYSAEILVEKNKIIFAKMKGFSYKDTEGFAVEYYNSTGQLRQMKMNETGISFMPEIEGTGNGEEVIVNEDGSVIVGKHYIIDHQPTQAEIDTLEEGTIIIVYDSTAAYIPTN